MLKKNTFKILGLTVSMSLSMSMQIFAGQWKQDTTGWWYENDDKSYPVNTWAWLDGNNDGIAECYYFNESGYCLTATTTPDNYTVNENGAWTVNGVVQIKSVNTFAEDENIEESESVSGIPTESESVSKNNTSKGTDEEQQRLEKLLKDMGITEEQYEKAVKNSLGESMYGGLH